MKDSRWNRRRFLQGAGTVALALPMLESLWPKTAQANRHRFLAVMRAGNGVVQQSNEHGERFWPREVGAISAEVLRTGNADRATSELADYADKLLMVKRVRLPFARNSCGHSEAIVQVLTAMPHTGGTANNPLSHGKSVDWHIAERVQPGVDPLVFMTAPTSSYIANAMSWSAPQQRSSVETSPRTAYMRMMGLSTAPPEVQQLVANRRKSVNDLVRDQMRDLLAQPQLSTRDRNRLDQHFSAVRDMELQASCDLDAGQAGAINALNSPTSNDNREAAARQFADLIAWAFNCRLNHVATLQIGTGNDDTQYTINNVKLPRFHQISHRIYSDGSEGQPIPDAIELHHQIDRLQLRLYRHLLYASPYGGTLLDDSVACWTNDLGDGVAHNASITPWIIAGSGGGTLRTGQVIDHQQKPVNLVLNTLLNGVGLRKGDGSPTNNFGDPSLEQGVVNNSLLG